MWFKKKNKNCRLLSEEQITAIEETEYRAGYIDGFNRRLDKAPVDIYDKVLKIQEEIVKLSIALNEMKSRVK